MDIIKKFSIPKWSFLRHNISNMKWLLGIFFLCSTVFVPRGWGEEIKLIEIHPLLKNLFSAKEWKEAQVYLRKDYHHRKRQEEIQERARYFFKKLLLMENEKGLKAREENRFKEGRGGNRTIKKGPYIELLEFLERSS